MTTRRKILIGAAAIGGFPAIARAQAARTLKFSHTDTPVGARHQASLMFAEKVEKYTSGRYKVQVFHSGQIANDPKSLEQLQVGGLDFAITGVVTFTTHVKPLSLVALPYLAENYQQGWKLYDNSAFIKAQANALVDKGMHVIGNWEAGFRCFTTNFALNSPADAKGMMVSAIRDPDPVVFLYAAGLRELVEELADDQYSIPLDKAAVRTAGNDITIVGSGGGMPEVLSAVERLQQQGMKVDTIDLRCLKPMDTEMLVKSVQKTKRLLTVDQSYYTLCPGAEVIARVAENVVGARFKRVAFPDAPPPAAPEMFLWMRPNADHIVAAAKKLVG